MEPENEEKDRRSNNFGAPPVLWQEQEQMASVGERGDARRGARRFTWADIMLCVDIEHGGDMRNPHVMGYLESLARRGKVAMMLGGGPMQNSQRGKVER